MNGGAAREKVLRKVPFDEIFFPNRDDAFVLVIEQQGSAVELFDDSGCQPKIRPTCCLFCLCRTRAQNCARLPFPIQGSIFGQPHRISDCVDVSVEVSTISGKPQSTTSGKDRHR